MSYKIASLFAEIGAKTDGLEKGLGTTKSGLAGLVKSFLPAISAAGALTTAIMLVKKGIEFSKEAAAFSRLEESSAAMARSIGLDMDDVLMAVRATSKGMVSDADIMASATRAMMLGVGTSASQMAQLMEVAAVRGRAMGLSATQAFNDIVTGIGRQSRMILDNLGIILDLEKVYGDYANALGIAADQLTDNQKKEAMLQAVIKDTQGLLKETGGLVVDAAGQWERLGAAQANFAMESKRSLLEAGSAWAEFWATMFEGAAKATDLRRKLKGALELEILSTEQFWIVYDALEGSIGDMEEAYESIIPTLDDYILRQENIDKALALGRANREDYAGDLRYQIEIVEKAAGAQVNYATTVGMAEKALRDQGVEIGKNNTWLDDQLALLKGDITPAQIALRDAIGVLTSEYATGNITQWEYIAGLKMLNEDAMKGRSAISLLSDALKDMPREVRTRILIEYGYETVPGLPGVNIPQPKAVGGPVMAGKPYLVGERGPELFVPETAGNVVPNSTGWSGTGSTINIESGAIQIFTQGEGVDAYALLDTLTEELGRR